MTKRLQTMLWHHNARVNSHQRWKQTRFRVCFHLWCELTLASWCHGIVRSLFHEIKCNGMTSFMEFMSSPSFHLSGMARMPASAAISVALAFHGSLSVCSKCHCQPSATLTSYINLISGAFLPFMSIYILISQELTRAQWKGLLGIQQGYPLVPTTFMANSQILNLTLFVR